MRSVNTLFLSVVFCVPLLAQPDTLTILHVNDTHSNLMPLAPRNPDLSGQRGGIARVATFVGYTRMTEPNVLFLHAGDASIGDPMYAYYLSVPELSILSQLGLDALAVGNHEFDLTPFGLQMALDTAALQGLSFPLLSANTILDDASVSTLKTYIRANTVRTFGDLKVGIFGLTTPETMLLSQPAPAVIDTNLGIIAAMQVATLAADTCDVIIMLSHLGHSLDKLVAENVPGIHVIVGGHDHELLTKPEAIVNPAGDTTWIVQAGAFYEYVGRLRLAVDGASVTLVDGGIIPMTDDYAPEEPQVKAIVEQLAADQEAVYGIPFFSQAVTTSERLQTELITDLPQRREAYTDVSSFVTRAFANTIPCDVAITACGATAQPIQAGPVTPADLYRAIGYGFNETNGLGYRMASYSLSGLDLMKGLEYGLSTIEANDEFFVTGTPLRYYYDPAKNPFERLDSVFINDEPVDPVRTYTIVSSEFILMFMQMLAPELGITVLNDTVYEVTEFEAVLGYVVAGGSVTGVTDDPIASAPPVAYGLGQNYPNPFNPSTTIRFSIPEDAVVELAVFDILGRQIETLVQGVRQAGIHTASWHARVATGVYFYRLRVTDMHGAMLFEQMNRMVLLR